MAIITIGKYLSNYKISRCGTIIYSMEEGKLYFLLAKDAATEELGDLGGGVKKYERALGAGLRELHEESRGIFSNLYKKESDLYPFITLVMDNMAIVFVPVPPVWIDNARQKFLESSSYNKSSQEICDLVWICIEDFNNLIFSDINNKDPQTSTSYKETYSRDFTSIYGRSISRSYSRPILTRNRGVSKGYRFSTFGRLSQSARPSLEESCTRRYVFLEEIQEQSPGTLREQESPVTRSEQEQKPGSLQGQDLVLNLTLKRELISSEEDHVLWVRIKNFLRVSLKDQTKFYACLKNHALRINKILKNHSENDTLRSQLDCIF